MCNLPENNFEIPNKVDIYEKYHYKRNKGQKSFYLDLKNTDYMSKISPES